MIAHSPVYYGWIIVAAGTLGLVMTTPGQTVGVSVFLDSLISDLELSRSTVSLMYTLGTLSGSFALPFVGRFIDSRGPRYGVVAISALFAVACLWMGFVNGLITLFLGFILIRGLGQGSLSLVSMHVINIWFVRRRGLAVGLAGIGMALGNSVFPLFLEFLNGRFGWRLAYMILGGIVAATMLPIGAAFYREHPERYGLQPDGATRLRKEDDPEEVSYSLEEARRSKIFWLFAIGATSVSGLGTGLIFHHYSIMAASGLDRSVAAMMFVPLGVVMAASNLGTGVLLDRVSPRFLLSAMLAFLCAALLTAPRVTSAELMLVYGSMLGLMQGMQGAIQGSVYAYYFGRARIGAIKGFATTISVAGSALGPLLFALGFDASGSYSPILTIAMVLPLTIGLAALFLKPRRQALSHR